MGLLMLVNFLLFGCISELPNLEDKFPDNLSADYDRDNSTVEAVDKD
jgi:hypothetical protein